MAEENDSSLIGYDPLAWMHSQSQDHTASADAERSNDSDPEIQSVSTVETEDSETWQEEVVESGAWQETDFADSTDVKVMALAPVLSIQNVAELHESLVDVLNRYNKIEIDASAVTLADTASLQLLLILKRTAISLQKEVVIDFPSERFIEAAELLGISEMLDVDQAAAGFF